MRVSDQTKQSRKERVLKLLQQHPDGLKVIEVADILGLERRTTDNYLLELENEGHIYKDGMYWVVLPHDRVVRSLDPAPEEAVMLYLAMRLLAKNQDNRNEIVENLLVDFASILKQDLKMGSDLFAAAQQLAQQPHNQERQNIYRTILQSYVYRIAVQITYQPYRGEPFETILHPYLLEPSAIGFATYVIGYSSVVNDWRTYKVERMHRAQLLRHDSYDVPHDFPGLDILRNAWSIYYGDETLRVVLRFSPDVTPRVQETIWHPSQETWFDAEAPNYLYMAVEVADVTDLRPWIRTWGAACEVLEPQVLREELIGEARQLARIYGISEGATDTPDHNRFDDIFGD